MEPLSRFQDAYILRASKETEEGLAEENVQFLTTPIIYFKQHKDEFLYLESESLAALGVDAVSFEVDDVFGNYDVMLGLKLPKKSQSQIKEYLQNTLRGNGAKFDLMFHQADGLWDLNFGLNDIEGFDEEMTVGEAYNLIYQYLEKLVEAVKQ